MTTDYRSKAKQHFEAAAESFERCDTDGFVSQFCSTLNGHLSNAKARIQEQGGVSSFVGLYEGERRVLAKGITTQYGESWLLDDSETDLIARRGKKFLPTGWNSRILKSLGLTQEYEMAPAWATIGGSGNGFSGLASAHVVVFRTGDKWGSDAVKCIDEMEREPNTAHCAAWSLPLATESKRST